MSDAAALARAIVVRRKAPGLLRLELPPALCGAMRAAAIEAGLRAVGGVQRVAFDAPARWLAIHFDPVAIPLRDVARELHRLLDGLPEEPVTEPAATGAAPVAAAAAPSLLAGVRRSVERLRAAEPPPGTMQARIQPILAAALTEKAITNFFNDLVAFYLIKVHWEHISAHWLRDPLKYRYAWLTTFYLVFLLIRYRKSPT